MKPLYLLRKIIAAPPQAWPKAELYDALYLLRVVLGLVLGTLCGVIGAQGLVTFLSFLGLTYLIGNAWLKWQGIDESEYEDPEKISQSPLSFEGFGPSVSFFMLLWVTTFTLAHAS